MLNEGTDIMHSDMMQIVLGHSHGVWYACLISTLNN